MGGRGEKEGFSIVTLAVIELRSGNDNDKGGKEIYDGKPGKHCNLRINEGPDEKEIFEKSGDIYIGQFT